MRFSTQVILLLANVLSAVSAKAANAQVPAAVTSLPTGARVRVTSSAPGLFESAHVANVIADRGDTLFLRPEGTRDSLPMPFGSITQLDVSAGHSSHIRKGMGLGFLGGALIGAGVSAATYKPCAGGFGCIGDFGQGGDAALAGVAFGLIGTVVGGAIGAVLHTENWERLAVTPGKVGFRFAPSSNGGVMVSATF